MNTLSLTNLVLSHQLVPQHGDLTANPASVILEDVVMPCRGPWGVGRRVCDRRGIASPMHTCAIFPEGLVPSWCLALVRTLDCGFRDDGHRVRCGVVTEAVSRRSGGRRGKALSVIMASLGLNFLTWSQAGPGLGPSNAARCQL
jgi:hypothetical protein